MALPKLNNSSPAIRDYNKQVAAQSLLFRKLDPSLISEALSYLVLRDQARTKPVCRFLKRLPAITPKGKFERTVAREAELKTYRQYCKIFHAYQHADLLPAGTLADESVPIFDDVFIEQIERILSEPRIRPREKKDHARTEMNTYLATLLRDREVLPIIYGDAQCAAALEGCLQLGYQPNVDFRRTSNHAAFRRLPTPLHWAANELNHHALSLLLKHGADPSIRNGNGHTAEDLIRAQIAQLPPQLAHGAVRMLTLFPQAQNQQAAAAAAAAPR
jgi:hypothetical protein